MGSKIALLLILAFVAMAAYNTAPLLGAFIAVVGK